MAEDPATQTLTEAALRSWAEEDTRALSGSTEPHSVSTGPRTGESSLPRLLRELADATAARLVGVEHAPVMLGDYELLRVVGSGGMGQVFAARAPGGEEVALKLLNRSSPRSLRRLKQEFRVLADVRHPNLVHLEQLVVLEDGVGFFTMELISGSPLVEHARAGLARHELASPERVAPLFVQLLAAVQHLHAAGFVHRDLKPSNVLVDGQGRVAVLDFGLVLDAGKGRVDEGEERLIGTPAYMAPEQSDEQGVGPAADLYAIGVMLFEALAGERPFRGSLPGMLIAKREQEAPQLVALVAGVDPELARLCQALLARDPSARPRAEAALAALGREVGFSQRRVGFVGRRAELASLEQAFAWVREHERPALVRVHGPSGQGKSSLARAFAARLGAGATVLRGRCYERESLAYKGFDAAIDALSLHLRQLPEDERPQLEPELQASLGRVFPVLAEPDRVQEQAPPESPELARVEPSPAELRAQAFEALAQLLASLGRRLPLVLVLDDFQWSDLASVQLLDALACHGGALAVMFLLTHRDARDSELLRSLDQLCEELEQLDVHVTDLSVGPLADQAGLELALALSGGQAGLAEDEARAQELLAAAGGNPFYLREIARNFDLREDDSDLDRLVARRIAALEPRARRLLELLALAGRPLAHSLLETLEAQAAVARELVEHDLLREAGPGALEPAHDRIREVAVAGLDEARTRERAGELLGALSEDASPDLLAALCELAGRRTDASVHAERAARQALDSLAFARGAKWLAHAAQLCTEQTRRWRLQRDQAEALASSGHFREAAKLLMQIAEQGGGDPIMLRSRAVNYLISAGWVNEGLAAIAELGPHVGIYPEERAQVLVPLVVLSRVRVGRELRRFRARRPAEIDPKDLRRLEVLHDISTGFAGLEVLQTNYWHLCWRKEAARLGHAGQFARAIGVESTITSSMHDGERWRWLRASGRRLMPEDDPKGQAWLLLQDVFTQVNRHRYDEALAACDELERLLAGGIEGASWERAQLRQLRSWAEVRAGRLRDAARSAEQMFRLGREAGDRKLEREGMGLRALALVRLGEREQAARAFAQLNSERRASAIGRFTFADMWGTTGWIEALLADQRVAEARAACERLARDMRPDGIWRVPAYRNMCLQLMAACELHAQLQEGATRRTRRRVRRLVRRIRSKVPMFQGAAAALEAGQAEIDGQHERARAAWERACRAYATCGCQAERAAVELRLARLLDGPEAGALQRSAQTYFERERIANPQGLLEAVAPAPG